MNLPSRLSSDPARRSAPVVRAARPSLHILFLRSVAVAAASCLILAAGAGQGRAQDRPAPPVEGASSADTEQTVPSAQADPVTQLPSASANSLHDLGQPQLVSQILAVDRDRLFSGSLYGRRVLAELEKERARLAAEARKVEAALAAEEKNLTEQRDKLTPQAFRVLADAFDEKVQALRAERPVLEQEFSRRFETERNAFFEKAGPILGQVVRDRGGVMIIDRRAILLTTQNIDVTDEAIQRIDAILGDGRPDPDADPAADEAETGTQPETQPETPAEN